jgi:hypothetical protein
VSGQLFYKGKIKKIVKYISEFKQGVCLILGMPLSFMQIDSRMKQISRSYEPFGGISVLCVGNFRQMKPVGDNYIFSTGRSNSIRDLGSSL